MNVELADERFLILTDRFSMDHAEGRATTKRIDAFGTLAKMSGFLNKPKDDDFELIYRERRLQPFWRLICAADETLLPMRPANCMISPSSAVINGGDLLEALEAPP